MPRPKKCRRVCQLPGIQCFIPVSHKEPLPEGIVLTVDEYETIRLIDKVNLSQEECGNYMGIARTTVQQIYTSARKKLATALVDGLSIKIEGGDYQLCEGNQESCENCPKRRMICSQITKKENIPMKIAIPLDENREDVCITFARAPYFLFQGDDGQTILDNPAADAAGGAGLQAAQFLVDQQATVLITVRCGQNAADVFQAAGLEIYHSLGQTADLDLDAYAQGKLEKLTHFHAGFQGIQ